MKILRLPDDQIPERYRDDAEYKPESMDDEYDLRPLQAYPTVDLLAYWYCSGCYCGAGQSILRINGAWYLHDCGHCSCYGPLDEIAASLRDPFASLDEVLARCSDDCREEVAPLVAMLRAHGYE